MKNFLLGMVCLLLVTILVPSIAAGEEVQSGQFTGNIEWEKTLGSEYFEWGNSIIQANDGGYVITGYGSTTDDPTGPFAVLLLKTDNNGNKQWRKTFGGNEDAGNSVLQTADSGYIIAGMSTGTGWLIKTDEQGDLQWEKNFGSGDNMFYSIALTRDGGYIITGSSHFKASSDDLWLVKTDCWGNKQWEKTFGSEDIDKGLSVLQSSDGGYVITGETASGGSSNGWLLKTDIQGNLQWDKTYAKSTGRSVIQDADGGYIITGAIFSDSTGNGDIWLLKTDNRGEKIWEKAFGGRDYDYGSAVIQSADNGYVISGFTHSYGAGSRDAWIIKTDITGNKQWDQTFGGTAWDEGRSVVFSSDGYYVITGDTSSYGAGTSDVWLIKVKAM
jgi:hypothetical protein